MNSVLTALTFCVAVAALQRPAEVYIAPQLGITATHTVQDALTAPFPDTYDVTLRGGDGGRKTLKNCNDFLALKGAKYSAGSSLDDANLRVFGTKCEALRLVGVAKPALHPSFANFSFRQITPRDLPPQFALNISNEEQAKAEAASQRGESLLAMEPGVKLRVKGADEARLVARDWSAKLTVYAHGDFLGDGNEELMVGWAGAATGGTYTSTSLFLLGKTKAGLVVVQRHP